MPEDSLNHHVWHTESIQIASQPAPRRMPSMPLRDAIVTPVGMVRFLMISLCLPACFAPIQCGKNGAIYNTA
jgi:hypothetical protein